jgi:hypothetical protein
MVHTSSNDHPSSVVGCLGISASKTNDNKYPTMSLPVSPYQCMNNLHQEIARTVVRKVSEVLSVSGSIYVLRVIYVKWRGQRSSVDSYQRIMAGLCVYDITFAFVWWFMGSWMTPVETGWWGAVGNTHSCTAQGALTDFALIGIWVSSAISTFASVLFPIIDFTQLFLTHHACRDRMYAVVSDAAVAIHAAPRRIRLVAEKIRREDRAQNACRHFFRCNCLYNPPADI